MRIVLVLLLMFAAHGAHAHAILMESQPAVRGTVAPGPAAVVLRYNSRIDAARSRLLLLRADHSQAPLPIEPGAPEDQLHARLDLPPGTYVIRWQVLAVDGHITRGDVPFTVSAATVSAPTVSPRTVSGVPQAAK